jgi:hypothetical protein
MPQTTADLLNSYAHTLHQCDKEDCFICNGGLSSCTVCGGAEATLPTDCPGDQMTDEQMKAVQDKANDFKNGVWV